MPPLNLWSTRAARLATPQTLGKRPSPSRPSNDDSSAALDAGARLIRTTMVGDLPAYNDWQNHIIDEEKQMLYLYGGPHINDVSDNPTYNFYVCDIGKMLWKDLTHKLRFSRPYSPFANDKTQSGKKPLPALQSPACAFLRINDCPFVFLFGGYDLDSGRTTSKLIAVDINGSTWYYVKIQGGPVSTRVGSCLVAIDNCLYIFGGRKEFDDVSALALASYCIAEYSVDHEEWTWVVRDQPYPSHVPPLGYDGDAISVSDGKKILLAPGQMVNDAPTVDISKQTVVLFHTENRSFRSVVETVGDFPTNVAWYMMYSILRTIPPSQQRPIKKLRASLSHSSSKPLNENAAGPSATTPATPSAVVLCCWRYRPDGHVVADLWLYELPPQETVTRLDFPQPLWARDKLDLQRFAVVKDRLFLMGYEAPTGSDDQAVGIAEPAVWNVCIEIKLKL